MLDIKSLVSGFNNFGSQFLHSFFKKILGLFKLCQRITRLSLLVNWASIVSSILWYLLLGITLSPFKYYLPLLVHIPIHGFYTKENKKTQSNTINILKMSIGMGLLGAIARGNCQIR